MSAQEPEKVEMDVELDRVSKSKPVEEWMYEGKWIYDSVKSMTLYLWTIGKWVASVSLLYVVWICVHYVAAHLYVEMCVPKTWSGFLMSPFMVNTPHCHGLRWAVYHAPDTINHMWSVIGLWIYSFVKPF